jgi:hypothetical protein
MNLQRILCGGTLLVGAIFFDDVVQAQVQTLDIIEHSSSSLTAKFNGTDIPAMDIVNTSSDNWTITIPGITENVLGFGAWLEGFEPPPSSTPIDNFVEAANTLTVTVQSEQDDGQGLGNGGTDTTHFTIGTAELDVTFTDNGDAVPDAAATFSLLSLSLAGLGFAKRMFLRTV